MVEIKETDIKKINTILKHKFADKLGTMLHDSGLSQESFAEELEVSRDTLEKWLRKETLPRTEYIIWMCNHFSCDIEYLFGQIDKKTKEATVICEETGLSEEAVNILIELNKMEPEEYITRHYEDLHKLSELPNKKEFKKFCKEQGWNKESASIEKAAELDYINFFIKEYRASYEIIRSLKVYEIVKLSLFEKYFEPAYETVIEPVIDYIENNKAWVDPNDNTPYFLNTSLGQEHYSNYLAKELGIDYDKDTISDLKFIIEQSVGALAEEKRKDKDHEISQWMIDFVHKYAKIQAQKSY